ncbi:MAG: Alkaline phosphatase synthesis sensor protein PhoR [Planctomycetota bacterium]
MGPRSLVIVAGAASACSGLAAWSAGSVFGAWAAALGLVVAAAGAAAALRDRRRIRDLAEVARAYGDGRYDLRAGLGGNDVIAGLGRDLDALGDRLQASRLEADSGRAVLEAALGALDEAVACVDALDRVRYANAAWRHLAADGLDLTGQEWYRHLGDKAVSDLVAAARAGQPCPPATVEHRRRHLVASAAAAGELTVIVLRDRTELHLLDLRRRDFLAGVSHELKTPLTAILGCADTLADGALDDDPAVARGFVERIQRHAERLASIVNDVLTLARLERGAWEVRPERCDAAAVVDEVVDAHREQAAARGVALAWTAGAAPARLDPELLRTLAANLLSNAIRYNRSEGRAEVRLEVLGDRLVLTVADTGIGIPAELQARVFDRFFRVDPARSRATGGTGLGLAIVRELVEALEGRIALASGPAGTTVTVDLPRESARAAAGLPGAGPA